MKRAIVLIVLLLAVLPLGGCWDRVEINDLAFILTTALDLEKNGQVRYSVLVPLPGQMGGATGGGGGTAGDKSYYIDSETGETIREAQAKLQKRMSRRMTLAHRRTLLVGEEMAQKGIRELFDSTARTPESRMTTYLLVTRGKAYDALQATPKFERFPSEAIRELAKSKTVMDINMKDVALELSLPGGDTVVPYIGVASSQKSEKPSLEVESLGYAQFRGDRMIGVFEERAAAGLAWLKNQRQIITATLPISDNNTLTVRFSDGYNRIKTRLGPDGITFDIFVHSSAKVIESTGYIDLSLPKNTRLIEQHMNKYIQQAIELTIAQMKKNRADSVQFGTYVWRSNPKRWEKQYAADWPAGLQQARFQIKTESTLAETGLIYENVAKPGGPS